MKAKLLSFAFICFLESGLFNELRPIQIKKLLSPSPGCSVPFSSDSASLDRSGQDKQIAYISVLDKKNCRKLHSHSGVRTSDLDGSSESAGMSVPGNVAGVSPATSGFSDRHVDDLELGELRQTFLPKLSADPRVFRAAERHVRENVEALASICEASRGRDRERRRVDPTMKGRPPTLVRRVPLWPVGDDDMADKASTSCAFTRAG
jgi:hypothetical protein